jgi:hypothetical protein
LFRRFVWEARCEPVSPVVHLSPASVLILFAAAASVFFCDSYFSVRSDPASPLASSGKAKRAPLFPHFQVIHLPLGSVLWAFLVSHWWSSVFILGSHGPDYRPYFPLPLFQLPLSAVRAQSSSPACDAGEPFGLSFKASVPCLLSTSVRSCSQLCQRESLL